MALCCRPRQPDGVRRAGLRHADHAAAAGLPGGGRAAEVRADLGWRDDQLGGREGPTESNDHVQEGQEEGQEAGEA